MPEHEIVSYSDLNDSDGYRWRCHCGNTGEAEGTFDPEVNPCPDS